MFELKFILSWEEETKSLEVQSFTIPQELLEKTTIQHIGALLCTVGVDCTEGKTDLMEEA